MKITFTLPGKGFASIITGADTPDLPDPTAGLREAEAAREKANAEAKDREDKARAKQQARATARRAGRASVSDLIALGAGGANTARPTLG